MDKFRKLLLSMLFVLVMCSGFVLSACGANDDKMDIKLSTTNVQIVLGENDNTATLTATVTDAKTLDVIVDYDSLDIKVTAVYKDNGVTDITVVAYRQCTDVEVTVKGAKKSVSFFVTATTPISSLSAKKDVHYIAYDPNATAIGGQFLLTQDLVQVYPQDTKQTEIRFSLPNSYLGVSIEDGNKLTIAKDLVNVPNTIDVDAVSAHNETVKATLHFEVIKAIDINQISILDGNTLAEASQEYEINRTTRSVSLQVVIPFTVHNKELNVKPIFKYNDTGIGWDTKSVERDDDDSVYRYTFEFNFTNVSAPNVITVEEVWFEISYNEYPEIKTSTLNLMDKDDEDVCKGIFKITKINEITGIAYYVEGVVSNAESLDVYTTYKDMSKGLEIQFEAVPTNATERGLVLRIDTSNPNFSFLKVTDSTGKNVEFFGGKHNFTAGEKFYFKAQSGFVENADIDITVESTENTEITRQIKIYLQEGVTAFGFKEGEDLVETNTFYLENDATSEFFSRTIIFGYSPISVKSEKFSVIVEGEVFESDGILVKNETYNTQTEVLYYDVAINAIEGATGQGTLRIRFQSGQEISAKIVVIQKLTDVNIDVDSSISISSAIGDIKYEDESLSYVAIKNGQSLPIKFIANAKVTTQTYLFSEIVYVPGFNVYSEDGEYSNFDDDNLFSVLGNPREYIESSEVIRPDILRTTQTISPVVIGKVWIKITFRGECLKEDFAYGVAEVSKYVCVEVYNPVSSIDFATPKNIEIYAADEVGKANAHLSKQYIEIELNKNSAYKPTYDKILWNGDDVKEKEYVYKASGPKSTVDILKIEWVEGSKYLLTVMTKTIPDVDTQISSVSIPITAPDITGESVYGSTTINISIKTVILTDKITPTNVPAYEDKVICQHCHNLVTLGQSACEVCENVVDSTNNYYIYLKTENISKNLADNKFKILTNVLPEDALNRNVVYEFIPDSGTNPNIIHISADGLVSVNDDIGGSGVIRILPQDALLEDENGRQYYRDGAPMALIRIVVADGASKETAILVNSLDEITNPELHYVLQYGTYTLDDVLFDSFSGGLYGKNEFVENKAIIKLNNTSLFNTISLDAIVQDLVICGTTAAESVNVGGGSILVGGLLTKVNNGTIENVEVDMINDSTVSSVTGSASNQYLGGLVGINYGTIQGSTFAGSVGDKGVVGGLVGANYGTIKQSNVLIYNFKVGPSEPEMKLSGNTVGGIAGEILGTSKIEQSYVYNFGILNSMYSFAGGALVGKISSKTALVKECFAQIGTTSQFYKNKDESITDNDIKSVIKDSYIIIKNGDDYSFAYYMTQKNGGYITGTKTEVNQLYENVNFGTGYTWNVAGDINQGYPYLTKVRSVAAVMDLGNVKVQKTALSLEEDNKTAIMYLYKEKGFVLTEMEGNLLRVANTISLEKLFGLTSTSGIKVDSSDRNIIETAVNSVTVKNPGVVKLTISSKYDRSIESKEVTICVLYYTSNLTLKIGSTVIGNDTVFDIKANTSQKITSSLRNTVVLLNREIPIMENDYLVNFYEGATKSAYVVGDRVGTHIVSATFDTIDDTLTFNVFLSLNLENHQLKNHEIKDRVQSIIKTNSLKVITAQKYFGPNKVATTIKKATISASDTLSFEVVVNSDNINEGISHIIFDSNGNVVSDMFSVTRNQLTIGSFDTVYNVTVSIERESLKNIEIGDYTVRFVTSLPNVYADVIVSVIAQEVIRVDVNNYAQSGTLDGGTTYNYYPSNVISPNSSSLLDITVYPAYAEYTHMTVTSKPVNNEKLTLVSMRKGIEEKGENTSAYYVDSANNSEFIENGVKIFKKITDEEIARYYVRVIASSAILVDSSYDIYVNVYNGEELVYTIVYNLVVMPQEKPGLSVNGQTRIFALLGEEVTVDIIKAKEQILKPNYYIDDTTGATVVFNNDWENYSAKYERATFTLYISDAIITDFIFKVQTSMFVNGKEEITESSILVYIIPFKFDINNTHIKNAEGNDVAIGDTYFNHELDFALAGEYTKAGEVAFNDFSNQGYYVNDDYVVNADARLDENPFKYGLYYVTNNDEYVAVTNAKKPDDIVSIDFIKGEDGKERMYYLGNMLGKQKMLLEIKVKMPDGTSYTYKYFFTIEIRAELNDDEPTQINSTEEFLKMFENQEEDHYILMRDIELYEYTPISDTSKILSFDGNGFTISIMSYNYDQVKNESINFALFETIHENTTIKNLRLNVYNINEISLQSKLTSNVNISTVAINNNGIITNAEVVSYRSNRASDVIPAISGMNVTIDSTINVASKTAGFVINNNGVITNSRVGGEITVEYTVNKTYGTVTAKTVALTPFVINSFGEIAGFVHSNNGHITSSFASNLRIVNNSNIDYATITAGFAINNQGIISMSYAKGVKANESDVHADRYGIETTGIAAGFVYSNAGTVSDCYSNITLTNINNPGRASAGFAYLNKEDARIEKSLSLSRIVGSTTTQMNFIGVNEWGYYQNNGVVENSYYYDEVAMEDDSILIEKAYGESARQVGGVNIEDYFYGFNFVTQTGNSEDGIWKMTVSGPELVSANSKTVSLRYTKPTDMLEKPKTTYVDEYRYGSRYNPILIRSAEEFNEVFAGTVNKSSSLFVNPDTKEVFGNYRIIKDIDLQDLAAESDTYRLASSQMELTGRKNKVGNGESIGKLDGNGFTIKGFALGDTYTNKDVENFGMFAKITEGATIMNLNIVIGATNKEGEIFGVEAKNVTNVGSIAGTMIDSKIVNINLTSGYEGTNSVTVRGKNIVGGLIGKVKGNSYIANISITDVSVTAVTYPENYKSSLSYESYNSYSRITDELNKVVSYAGGIVGVFDAYTPSTQNVQIFSDAVVSSNTNGIMLKTKGVMQITGGTVGGIVGYVGPLTIIQDALFDLAYVEDDSTQGLYSYNGFAGGVVGYNLGYLRQVRAEHNNTKTLPQFNDLTYQDAIELSMAQYYKPENLDTEDSSLEVGNEILFHHDKYYPIAIGGLVGAQRSGKIEKSYAKINVKTTNGYTDEGYAGGIIGLTEQLKEGELAAVLHEVYATGDVRQVKYAGGIVGFTQDDKNTEPTKFEKVNALNFWGKWALKNKEMRVYAFAYTTGAVGAEKDLGGLEKTAARHIADEFKDKDVLKANYLDQTLEAPKFTEMNVASVNDNGEMFDQIFKGNDWDSNSWGRDEDELFPHMLFGYHSNVIVISNQNDIEKLRTTNDNTFGNITYVIDPDDSKENYHNGDVHLIGVTKKFAPIVGFSSVLRGVDDKHQYGFLFKDKNQSKALFKSTSNATFKDFIVQYKDIELVNTTTQGAALVEVANNTEFVNLELTGIKIVNKNALRTDVGVLCAVSKGATTFNNIDFNDCQIELASNTAGGFNTGILFGSATMSGGRISNVRFSRCDITTSSAVTSNISLGEVGKSSNIGTIGGALTYTGHEFVAEGGLGVSIAAYEKVDGPAGSEPSFRKFSSKIDLSRANLFSVNVGGAFGSTSAIKISGRKEETRDSIPESEITISNAIYCDIGGLVGETLNGEIYDLSIKPTIKTKTEIIDIISAGNIVQNSNIGGVCGYSCNTPYNNIIVGSYKLNTTTGLMERESKISCNAISRFDEGDVIYANIGAMSGFCENVDTKDIKNVKTYIDINLILNGVTEKSNSIFAGGTAGKLLNADLEDVSTYGDIMVSNKTACDSEANGHMPYGDLYVAGMVAHAKNISVKNGYTFGNLKNNIAFANYNGTNLLAMSGLVAKAEGEVTLNGCIAAGNTYPEYKLIIEEGRDGTTIKESIAANYDGTSVSNSQKCDTFMYGGLIADADSTTSVKLISNYSINSLVNKREDNFIRGERGSRKYYANAFVGKVEDDAKVSAESTINKFAHAYTMVLNDNKIGYFSEENPNNVLLNAIMPDIQEKIVGKENVPNLTAGKHDYFVVGSKINPQINFSDTDLSKTADNGIVENKYVYLNESQKQPDTPVNLINSVIVADGADIMFAPISAFKTSTFGEIDDNSIVAGLRILANYTVEREDIFSDKDKNKMTEKTVSGFANKNKGIIYSCVVRGGSTGAIITGTIHSRKNAVCGFVNENEGLIKNSFVEVDVISNEAKNTISAFVVENTGYIVTCYASGSIKNLSADKDLSICGFANGGVYGCYSIVKFIDDDIIGKEKGRFVFDVKNKGKVEKSFYDMYAAEALLYWDYSTDFYTESEYGKKTNDVSASYDLTTTTVEELNETEDTRVYYGDLKSNINYAYGYGSFYDSLKSIDYMHHDTGDGGYEEIKMFQIPNLGKLNQIFGKDGETTYYNVVKDIDGSYITNVDENEENLLQWKSKSVKGISLKGTGISGSAQKNTIKNVDSYNGGLFDNVENSRISQINLEKINIKSIKADTDKTNSVFGLLLNKSTNSTISDLYIEQTVSFLRSIGEIVGSEVKSVKFGFVVGKVQGDGSKISNCNVVLVKAKDNNVLTIPVKLKAYNWSIGGIIGILESGNATNLKLSDSEWYIDFDSNLTGIEEKTYIVGGIVAEQTGGSISKSIFNSKMYAFNNDQNCGDKNTLYAGGIVGKVKTGLSSSVEECLTQQVSSVMAGNHYSFITVYAGGISGHGGKIENCKNMASVVAYATYTYGDIDNGDNRDKTNGYEENLIGSYWKNSTVDRRTYRYKMYNGADNDLIQNTLNFNALTKVLYAEVMQDAHAAGIANEYESIKNCLNTSKTIRGGTKSENLHSYYKPTASNSDMWGKFLGLTGQYYFGFATYITGLALMASSTNLIQLSLAAILSLLSIGVMNDAISKANVDFHISAYNMMGNGLTNNTNEYINYTDYFVKINSSLGNGSVYKHWRNRFETFTLTFDWGYFGGNILPYGNPVMIHQGQITKTMLSTFTSGDLEFSNIKSATATDGKTYYYAEKNGDHCIEIREIYFDTLGLSQVAGATIENSVSTTQVFNTVSLDTDKNNATPAKDYYSITDNSSIKSYDENGKEIFKTVCEEYNLVYADGSLESNAHSYTSHMRSAYKMDKLTGKSGAKDLDGKDGEVWKEVEGEYVLDNVENEKADLSEFLSGEGAEHTSKVNLTECASGVVGFDIYDIAGYNLMREIINTNGEYLFDKENEVKMNASQTGLDNYAILVKMFKNQDGYTVNKYKVNIMADITDGVTAQLGTEEYPFVGDIVGKSNGGKVVKLTGVKNAVSAPYSGLVKFAKNLTISNLDIRYSDLNYALTETEEHPVYHVGGLVGNLVKDGILEIKDIKLVYNFKDYYEEVGNKITSLNPITVGGLVGFVDTNSIISLKDNVSINGFNVDLKSEGETTNPYNKGYVDATYDENGKQTSYVKGVGVYVGSMRNTTFEVDKKITRPLGVENVNINVNSTNTIVGGLIGYASAEKYFDDGEHPGFGTISLSNIEIGRNGDSDRVINVSANTQKLPVGRRTVSVGGLIGKLNGEYAVELDQISVNLKQISGNTNKPGTEAIYVGGLIGEVTSVEKITGLKIKESGVKTIQLGNPSELKERLYITAGIGGEDYPQQAYANMIIGNLVVEDVDNVETNAKCYAMTKPYYVANPLDIHNPKNYKGNTTIYKDLQIENKLRGYLKIDTFEFAPVRDKNIQHATVDGKDYSVYNYQQEYLVVVIHADKTTSSFKASDFTDEDLSQIPDDLLDKSQQGKDIFTFIESYYRVTIDGIMANDNDLNLVKKSKIELIRTNKFNTTTDIYDSYHNKVFPVDKRIVLDGNNEGFYPNPSELGEYMVKVSISDSIGSGGKDPGTDDIKVEKVNTANYKSYINEELAKETRSFEPRNNNVDLKVSFAIIDKEGNGSKTVYENMVLTQTDDSVSLNINVVASTVSENVVQNTVEKDPIKVISFRNIYKVVDEDKNNKLSYVLKDKKNPDEVNTVDTAQVFMDLGNGYNMPLIEKCTTAVNYDLDIKAELSETFTLHRTDGTNVVNEQAKILIISRYYKEDGLYNDMNYDDIYLIKGDTELKMFYLGNIKYEFSGDYKERNEFFFPIPESGEKIERYENNVIALNMIKDISDEDFPYGDITITKEYGVVTRASINLETKVMESRDIRYYMRDKSDKNDFGVEALFQFDKTETKTSTKLDITVDVKGLNQGLSKLDVSLGYEKETTTYPEQYYENVNANEYLKDNTFVINNILEGSKIEVYEADGETLKGYEKYVNLTKNDDLHKFTLIYNAEKELTAVVETIERTGQSINYAHDGTAMSYSSVTDSATNNIMWYMYDYTNNLTYYSFTNPNENPSATINSLPGIYQFSVDEYNMLVTATNNNKENIGIQRIVFEYKTNQYYVTELVYTQNVINSDKNYTLYMITETYADKFYINVKDDHSQVDIEGLNRIAPSMNGISATVIDELIAVSLSDVLSCGEVYVIATVNITGGTTDKYLREKDLYVLNVLETTIDEKFIVYQEEDERKNVKIYLYKDGIYEEFKHYNENFNDFFDGKTITDVEISEAEGDLEESDVTYLKFKYSAKNTTDVVYMEKNIPELHGYIIQGKDTTAASAAVEYDAVSNSLDYIRYYYNGATRLYISGMGVAKNLIIKNGTEQDGDWRIDSITPIDNNTDYSLNLIDGKDNKKHYTLKGLYEIFGTIKRYKFEPNLFTNSDDNPKIKATAYIYSNNISYSDENGLEYNKSETLVARMDINTSSISGVTKEYTNTLIKKMVVELEDGVDNVRITTTKVSRTFVNAGGKLNIRDAVTCQAQNYAGEEAKGDARDNSGTTSYNLTTVYNFNNRVIYAGKYVENINSAIVADYQYGTLSDGGTTGLDWSIIYKIAGKSIFDIQTLAG